MIQLIACSICLCVWSGSEWLAPERVIRELNSYDGELPRLHGAVCDDCDEAISLRRAHGLNPVPAGSDCSDAAASMEVVSTAA